MHISHAVHINHAVHISHADGKCGSRADSVGAYQRQLLIYDFLIDREHVMNIAGESFRITLQLEPQDRAHDIQVQLSACSNSAVKPSHAAR